jgi:hypothetical protein
MKMNMNGFGVKTTGSRCFINPIVVVSSTSSSQLWEMPEAKKALQRSPWNW